MSNHDELMSNFFAQVRRDMHLLLLPFLAPQLLLGCLSCPLPAYLAFLGHGCAWLLVQPDALAVGKSAAELKHDGCPEALIPHRTMPGNRPSSVILLPKLGAYETGACSPFLLHPACETPVSCRRLSSSDSLL